MAIFIAAHSRNRTQMRMLLAWAAVLLLAAWAAWTWISTVTRLPGLYLAIPTEDYWRVVQNLTEIQSLDFRFLWRQHNEHRIIFPDIVFALDVWLAHGRRILPIVISFLCYLGSWLILARLISRELKLPVATRTGVICLTAVLMGWKGCTLVLANPFLLQWTMVEFSALASLVLLARAAEENSRWHVGICIVSAVIATYCSANGLLLWIVLLVGSYLLKFNGRQILLLASSAIVADGLYFVGYRFSGKTNLANLILHPWSTVCFLAVYLSMPFGGMKSPRFGMYIGLIVLGVTAWLLCEAIRRGLLKTRFGTVLFGYYGFTLLTAILTAAGRMDLTDPTFDGAKATRYLVPVTINWAILLTLAIWIASIQKWGGFLVPVLEIFFTVLLFVSFLKLKWWLRTGSREFVDGQITQLSIENGILDPRLLLSIFPDPHFVESYLPRLRDARLSIFYSDRNRSLGTSMTRFGRERSGSGKGEVTRVFPVLSGVEIVGWAARANEVVVANERDEVIGFGLRPPEGLPSELLSPNTVPHFAWVAFVPARYALGRFRVYLVETRTRDLLPLQRIYSFPLVQAANRDEVGPAIPGLTWQHDASWIADGMGPHEPITSFQPAGATYGTWNGSVNSSGAIRSSTFAVPANQCVIVPVLHGPSTAGLSVELLNGETETLIERMPMQDEDVQWEFWRVPIPQGVRRLKLVASDQGAGLGQWLAVASPAECR